MRYFISIMSILFIFSSCKDKSNDIEVFKAIDEGLEQSNKIISYATDGIYREMEERLAAPETSEIMKVWQPKAAKVKELTDSMVSYINRLKEDLVSEGGPVNPEDKNALDRNETVVDHVFQSHGKGKELFEKLVNYKREMLSIDSTLSERLKDNMVVFSKDFDHSINGSDEFTKVFFSKKSAVPARVMLSKFENNIKINESIFTNYCNSQMCILNMIYDPFVPLVSLSSSNVKVGEEIEINAGVGAFTTVAQLRITINNVAIAVNNNGLGIYRFKTPQKTGAYHVPVKIEFTRQDGRKEVMTKTITYTVQ